MAGQKYITERVLIADWPAYRARHGLEIVRASWPWPDVRPTLVCRPFTSDRAMVAPDQAEDDQPPIDQQEA